MENLALGDSALGRKIQSAPVTGEKYFYFIIEVKYLPNKNTLYIVLGVEYLGAISLEVDGCSFYTRQSLTVNDNFLRV